MFLEPGGVRGTVDGGDSASPTGADNSVNEETNETRNVLPGIENKADATTGVTEVVFTSHHLFCERREVAQPHQIITQLHFMIFKVTPAFPNVLLKLIH